MASGSAWNDPNEVSRNDENWCTQCAAPPRQPDRSQAFGVWVQVPVGNMVGSFQFFCDDNCVGQFVQEQANGCQHRPQVQEVWTGSAWVACQGPAGFVRCPHCENEDNRS